MMLWQHAHGSLEIGNRPVLMGILNITPDSFSDGGSHFRLGDALARAEEMATAGAHILDVGGESTRPGATPVEEEEELRRVIPVIEAIHRRLPHMLISVDTYKARVALEALKAGAAIVNDVSAGRWSPGMLEVLSNSQAGYVAMHSLDRPDRMQLNVKYADVVAEVYDFLAGLQTRLESAGINSDRLVFDAGIGFGKSPEHNLKLIAAHETWGKLGRPILWGISRKSFISKILNVEPDDRLTGSLSLHARLLESGLPQIWRVHEVEEYAKFLDMWFRLDLH
ncbi:MAG: dihydropteroate synthase [Methylacidiphilales bacterium]|nr:dihydropteroate synthase [Candidatus Methylacidiphilales bacterium]